MEFSSIFLVLHLTYSSNLTLTRRTCFFLISNMTAPQAQYKWVAKYPDRLPETSGWMDQKKEVIRDFTQFIETEQLLRLPFPGATIDPIKSDPNSKPIYYLDKRIFFGKSGPFLHFCHAEKAIHAVPLESEVSMERPSLDPTERTVDERFLRLHQAVQ